MESGKKRQRLDEILSEQGKISDQQIKIALKHQKIHGGKFGSHILHHGFIDETELVKALAEQFDCPGVVLSNLEIPEHVLEMIPHALAVARKIIAFDYDADKNILHVACEDPSDEDLARELGYVVPDKTIVLHVAVEIALNFAISRHYGKIADADTTTLQIRDESVGALKRVLDDDDSPPDHAEAGPHKALLVTDASDGNLQLRLLLEDDGFDVALANSVDGAMKLLAIREFDTLLVRKTAPGDHSFLSDYVRKEMPGVRMLYFEQAIDLMLPPTTELSEDEALKQNLELFTSLLTIQDREPNNHTSKAGEFADRMCGKLGVTARDRMYILNAAYLHERAKFYYMSARPRDFHSLLGLTIKLLQSVYYEPSVVEMLRSMYVDLRRKTNSRRPIEVLGGNILTIVDMYCDTIPPGHRMTLDRFDPIRKKFDSLVGETFLPEVVAAFSDLINEEIVNSPMFSRLGQIMLFSNVLSDSDALSQRLKHEGFRTIGAAEIDGFMQLFRRSQPDMLVLHLRGPHRDIIATVNDLSDEGIDFKEIPTFVYVENAAIPHLTSLMEQGVEDIIESEAGVDMVALKVKKAWAQMEVRASRTDVASQHKLGSTGSLSDMNLIDLLQALGPSRRTTKITVTSAANGEKLELYLDQGNIIFAQVDDLQGAEAIYLAMTWEDGTWTLEPLKEMELREPNNDLSNEAILMEGCRLKDEIVTKLARP